VEYFPDLQGNGAAVGVGGHEISHIFPPPLTHLGFGNVCPPLLIFDLDIGKQLSGSQDEENGVVVNAMGFKRILEFPPDRVVACFVCLFTTCMD
jgi:hypothetical protein